MHQGQSSHIKPFVIAALIAIVGVGVSSFGAAPTGEPGSGAAPHRAVYPTAVYAPGLRKRPSVAALTELGRAMFFDPSLSASGRLACASCHSPDHAYGPPNAQSAQPGGEDMQRPGSRAVPSLRYMQNIPPFSEHHHEDDGDDSIDAGPTGGRTWDGRASSSHDQARIPLLSAHEMANKSPGEVVRRLRNAAYADRFREAFGQGIFEDERAAFHWVLMALEVFQEEPAEFYPYSSKYDAFLRGTAKLTEQEQRGLALFNSRAKGNCALCHPSAISRGGAFPQFTDFGYIALGAPRNNEIAANADPQYFDLGLCGPERKDFVGHKEYCGLFRTPTLRNVAMRGTFFHNGVFHTVEEVLRFYAQRDTHPEKWYPRAADGGVRKFDDLPAQYRGNVNMEAPFGQRPGEEPSLSEAEIRDVLAFLKTLSDGYRP
jgi:cytochrome c peroxidase